MYPVSWYGSLNAGRVRDLATGQETGGRRQEQGQEEALRPAEFRIVVRHGLFPSPSLSLSLRDKCSVMPRNRSLTASGSKKLELVYVSSSSSSGNAEK